MIEFKRKLHDDEENEVLIEMSQQLVYNEDKVKHIMEQNGGTELLQEDMVELALHMSNDYINQERPNIGNTSPLQDKRDYFNESIDSISNKFFNGNLPDIKYLDTTAKSSHDLVAQDIYKMSLLDHNVMKELIEKEPNIEKDTYNKIKADIYDESCNQWCNTCDIFSNKAKEYRLIDESKSISKPLL